MKLEKQADFTKTKMDQLAKDVNEANDTLDQIMKNRSSDIENMENKISNSLVSISFTFYNFFYFSTSFQSTFQLTNGFEATKVAFDAYRTSPFEQNYAKITYSNTSINLGNGLNISSGIFTAPIAGYYFFIFQSKSENVDFAWATIYHNGEIASQENLNFPSATVSCTN